MVGALSGYRVIDITSIVLGPYGGQLLGDMGADIVKVEAPPIGDTFRYVGKSRSPGMGGPFLNANRNKRSICLDLKQQAGKDALARLIEGADVLVHNMRPKAIAGLGFDYDAVAAIKPEIIYCGCYGFSQQGRYGDKPAFDDLIQAASGIADLFGSTLDGVPRYTPTVMVDKMTGLMMSQAVIAALLHRERTGEGQFVEVPMFETMVSFLMVEHLYDHAFEPPLGSLGYARLTTPNRKPNKAKDGYVAILPYNDRQWAAFFDIAGRPELNDDPRFRDHSTRNANIHEIYALLEEAIAQKTTAEWMELCEEVQIPAMPVMSLEQVFDDPHLAEFGMFQAHEHPSEGKTVLTKPPVTFSKSPASIERQAPRLGQQGEEILAELGYGPAEIAALRENGVLHVTEGEKS